MLRACRKIAFRMISRSAGNRLRPTIFSAAPPHRSGGAATRCAARGRPGPQHAIPTWKNVDVPGTHSRNRRSKAVVVTEDPTPGQIPLNSEVNNRRAQVSRRRRLIFECLPVRRRWRSKRRTFFGQHQPDQIPNDWIVLCKQYHGLFRFHKFILVLFSHLGTQRSAGAAIYRSTPPVLPPVCQIRQRPRIHPVAPGRPR